MKLALAVLLIGILPRLGPALFRTSPASPLTGAAPTRRQIDSGISVTPADDVSLHWHPRGRYLLSRAGVVPVNPKFPVAPQLREQENSEFMSEGCDWDPKSERIVLSRHSEDP